MSADAQPAASLNAGKPAASSSVAAAAAPAGGGGGGSPPRLTTTAHPEPSHSPCRTNSDGGDLDSVRRRGGPGRDWVRRALVIMQFNVLARMYQPRHLPNDLCKFEVRCELIASQIEYHLPDVIAMQEVNPVSWYRARFGDWYDIAFASKQDFAPLTMPQLLRNENDLDDGACLMVRKGVVEFVQIHHLRFRDNSPKSGDPCAMSDSGARQFALLAECRHVATGASFYLLGMHMKANNGTESQCARRVCHMLQLLPAIDRIRQQRPAPMIFAGDFNSAPGTPTIDFLLRGRARIENKTYQNPTKGVRFASAMAGTGPEGGDPEFTILDSSWGQPWSSVLDYILYEPDCFTVTGAVSCPPRTSFGTDAIPFSGSDHIPLVAELAFIAGREVVHHRDSPPPPATAVVPGR